ncbi:MAG: DUF1349 domain-containing protein [Arachnia sp.]
MTRSGTSGATDGLARLLAAGSWTHPPQSVDAADGRVVVTAVEGSDAWCHTSYGFVHDSEHALLEPFGNAEALEVSFVLDFEEQFDQAGVFLRASEHEWIKAGIEASDGQLQVGAVVTHVQSDWSVAPVPEWGGRVATVRASRDGDAVTIRARVDDEPWRLVRVAHLDPDHPVEAGIFCAAPTRAGLRVTFTGYRRGPADASLH